jgi:hypothetical protein
MRTEKKKKRNTQKKKNGLGVWTVAPGDVQKGEESLSLNGGWSSRHCGSSRASVTMTTFALYCGVLFSPGRFYLVDPHVEESTPDNIKAGCRSRM